MTTTNSSVTTTLASNVDDLVLTGTANINGTGNTLSNTITGNSGANVLDGRAGADTLVGGAGNDTYVVDNAGDRVVENADEGSDTVNASISTTLADNVENLTLTGTGAINGTGNAANNLITGNNGANSLYGMDGNDTLVGSGGNDTLDGGTGADAMIGGTGDDNYVVDSTGDIVTEAAGGGNDTVSSSIDLTLGDNLEHLTLTGSADLAGTGNVLNNTITGNSGANTIQAGAGLDTVNAGLGNDVVFGGDGNDNVNGQAGDDLLFGDAGNDTVDGGVGADTMEGGIGDDTYVVDNAGDLVAESAGAGLDNVQSGISYTLTGNVENLGLTGAAQIDGTGNELGNVINGNGGANLLLGLDGNDTLNGNGGEDQLFGGEGDDILDGGAGTDLARGGSGDDTYHVDSGADLVIEQSGEGTDRVVATANYTLSAAVENLTLGSGAATGTGNELDNLITGNGASNILMGLDGDDTLAGNAGNDTLDGGSGADDLQGGIGDDTYMIEQLGDRVTELAGSGNDTARSTITYTLTDHVENLQLLGSDQLDGTGNALGNLMNGNAGSNTLAGGAGNDSVDGGAGDDTLYGEAGDDTLHGGLGSDLLEGGSGNDTYTIDDALDLVAEAAGAGTDLVNASVSYTLTGNVENLTLTGTLDISGTGNELANTLTGNAGANVLDGKAGDDVINGNTGADTLIGGEGVDTLNGEAGDDQLRGDAGNDTLDGGQGIDLMAGGTGNDIFVVDNVQDRIVEIDGEGVDLVRSSVDHLLAANVENVTLTGGASVSATGNELDNAVTGNNAHNALFGLDGNDTLSGMGGNDSLDGGLGADRMLGGTGDDAYTVDNAGDLVEELANGGTDTVSSSIDYTLSANVEHLTLLGTDDLNGVGNALSNIITGNSGNNTASAGDGADKVYAGAGNDVASGGNGDDALYGEAGEDRLFGDAGNDTLNGGSGADTMAGGLGDDTFVVDDARDLVLESAGAGSDLTQSGITWTLTDNVENLTLTGSADIDGTGNELDNVINGNTGTNVLDGKSGNDTLNGNLGNDILVGGQGDDLLNGGSGADNMAGGVGNDVYVVDSAGDLVAEAAPEGSDTVQSSISYSLGDNVEHLTLTGSALIDGSGNALDNAITGNSAANDLFGGDGNDTLSGNGGDDVLDGGSGADVLAGGIGNDRYIVDNAGDLVNEAASAGLDTVQSSIDYVLGANVEQLVLGGTGNLAGTGNTLANTITGNAGNNLIDGGAGIDSMSGGAGDDTYIVDANADAIVEEANAGIDVAYSGASYTLSANVENLVLTGSLATNGFGNAQDNAITGNEANNSLAGFAGNDSLSGGAGDDFLDGGSGADALAGGTGNDTYFVDNADDIVSEAAGEGMDTVRSSISFALGANVEHLTQLGSANIDATGNAFDNLITGNSGNNLLDGGAGKDTLAGGAGNDTYRVDAADTVTEAANAGTDTVEAGFSYTLGANLENLVLLGSGDLTGSGNALVNDILGNEGANLLDGGAGADVLAGGAGDDTYIVDNMADVVREATGNGIDTVLASDSYVLSANVENLVLQGSNGLAGTGNALDNVITGNSARNTLVGELGNDILMGGAGNDVLRGGAGDDRLDGGLDADLLQGGAGNDTYVLADAGDTVDEAAGEGTDTVLSSASHALGDNVENLVLSGSANLQGSGNALDNVITGSSGDNVLSGMDGDDTLDGGAGNDVLIGGMGNDTYLFGTGDGHDRIHDATGSGTLNFRGGLTAADLHAGQSGRDLVLTIVATGESVVLTDWLGQSAGVTNIAFDDGSSLDQAGIAALLNAAPTAADDTLVVGEEGGWLNVPVTQLLGNDVDPDAGDVVTVISVGASGIGANIDLDGGMLGYDIGTGYQHLAAGDIVNDSFSYTISDVMGETSSAVVHVQIIGANDAAVVEGDANATVEGGAAVTGNVLANDSDIDNGTVLQVAAPGSYAGVYGTLDIAQDGSYSYALNADAANVQGLNEGEAVLDTFAYVATDGIEGVGSNLAITITGTNDAPVLTADVAQAAEEGTIAASGNVLANDSDADTGAVLTVAGPGSYTGAFGTLALGADGSYTYSLDNAANAVQALAAGQTVVDSFSYAVTDGVESVASSLAITITGTNDAPVVTADVAQVTEDSALAASGNVLANDSDADTGAVLTVDAPGSYTGAFGTLALGADGSYTYSLDNAANAVQALAAGQTVVDSFSYAVTDGVESVASSLAITITGTNDAPVLAADNVRLLEDAAGASGNVLANDSDVDAGTVLAVTNAGTLAGSHGKLTLGTNGAYAYQLDTAAAQSLGRKASVAEHFAIKASDGIAGAASSLDITVAGVNDAPIVVKALADKNVTFNKAFSFKLPTDSFKDIDQGDKLTYTAALADGAALPSWLKFDAATGTFSGKSPKQVGKIDVRVTATDQAADGSTAGSLSASDVFSLAVSHGNEGLGNGDDAPPAGHDENQNDGPGTSPGNPGSAGGKKISLSIGISASNGVASVAVSASVEAAGGSGPAVPSYLNFNKVTEYALPASSIGNSTSAQSFGLWLAVDLAVSAAQADKKSLTWLDERNGADTGAIAKASFGFLGSTTVFGGGALSVSAIGGVELKGFAGLGQGARKIK